MANFHRITPGGDYYTNGAVIDEVALATTYSVQFNGSQYLTSTNAAGWLPSSAGDWTMEAWVYLTGYSASYSGNYVGMIASSSVTNNNSASWQFYVSGTASSWTSVSMTFWTTSASGIGFNTTLNLNTWYHIAVTKQGSTVRLFVNGILLGSGTPTTNNGTTVLRIGDLDNASFRYFFPGYISNFRIVKGTALYTNNFVSPANPLTNISNTTILTCQSATIVDNGTANTGGTGFTITNPNGATVDYVQSSLYKGYFTGAASGTPGTYLSIPSGVMIFGANSDFTVECWVYPTSLDTGNGGVNIFDNWIGSSGSYSLNQWKLWILSTGELLCDRSTSTSSVFVRTITTATISINKWTHIAMVRTGGSTITLYINGVASGTPQTYTGAVGATGTSSIGGQLTGSSFRFAGYISNVRLVNGTAMYTSNFTPQTTPLTAVSGTSLLTLQSPTIIDNSSNAYTITNTGPVTVQAPLTSAENRIASDGSFYTTLFDEVSLPIPYSVKLNGSTQYLTATGSQTPGLTTENFTIECWFNLSSFSYAYPGGSYGACILNASNAPFTGGNGGVWVFIGGSLNTPTDIALTSSGSTVGPQAVASGLSISLNTWHHLAISRNGSNLAIWLNGVKLTLSTNTIATSGYTAYPISIGVTTHSSGYAMYFNGYISNLRIVKGTPVYDPTGGNISIPAAPLTAVTGTYLLTCQSPTIIDNSTNAFTISNPNAATVDYGSTGLYRGVFNGTTQYLTTATASISSYDFNKGNYSIEFWMNPGTFTTETAILCAGPATSGALNRGWGLELHNGTSAGLWFYQAGVVTSWTNLGSYTANVWQHVAIVRNGATITAYVNGTAVGTTSAGGSTQTAFAAGDIFFIGCLYNTGNVGRFFYNGSISNLRIVKGPAVPYTSNFTPPYGKLLPIINTSLLTLQSSAITDGSINGYTITNNGAVTVQSPLATATKRQWSNGALQISGQFDDYSTIYATPASTYSGLFNSTSDNLTIVTNTASQTALVFGTSDFTLEAWIRPTSITTGAMIYDCRTTYPTLNGFALFVYGTLVTISTNGNTFYNNAAGVAPLNTWTHVALVKISGVYYCYVNGFLAFSQSYATSLTDNATFYIGRTTDFNTAYQFNGYISNLRIVKGAGLYTSNFTPSTTALTAVSGTGYSTSLLTLQNSTAVDNSGNGLTITNNNVDFTADVAPF